MTRQLSQNELDTILKKHAVGRIGYQADGITHIVPISYAYDGEFVYGHIKEMNNTLVMAKNSKVCFEVDNMGEDVNWTDITCWGKFEELTTECERLHALKKLHDRRLPLALSAASRLSPEWPFEPLDFNSIQGVVFRIRIFRKTGYLENCAVVSSVTSGW